MQKNAKKSKTELRRSNFSKTGLLFFLVIFAAVGGYVLWKTLAAPTPPAVYLSPATKVNAPSSTFSVQIRENSGTTSINAVQTNLTYPTTLLTLVSVDFAGSGFGSPPTVAQNIAGSGSVKLAVGVACGATCGTLTGDQTVAKLNFKVNSVAGTASMPFTAGTALLSSTTNQNILSSLNAAYGGTYTLQ